MTKWCILFLGTLLIGLPTLAQQRTWGAIPKESDEVGRMIDSIKNMSLPPTPESLYQATEDARQAADFYASKAADIPKQLQSMALDDKKTHFHQKLEDLRKNISKCNAANAKDFFQQLEWLDDQNSAVALQSGSFRDRKFDFSSVVTAIGGVNCQNLNNEFINGLSTKFDTNVQTLNTTMNAQIGFCSQLAKAWQDRISVLAAEKSKLAEKKQEQQASDILRMLPWIVGCLCIFSFLILFGVRFFTPEVQMELVSSGQVIQFPTVMVLLVVVIALGLAGILKENSLAALLGGLAGYVLSQGVGKAAARRVEREQLAATATERAPLAQPAPALGAD